MSRRAVKILITVVAIVIAVPTLLLVGLYALIGGFHDNVAKDASQPVIHAIEAKQASQVCDSGDAGYGPDNTQPWYQASYEMKDSPNLDSAIIAAAKKQGYDMRDVTQKPWKPPTQNLEAKHLGRTYDVYILRGKQASAGCNSGKQQKAKAGDVIVEIDLQYPYLNAGS